MQKQSILALIAFSAIILLLSTPNQSKGTDNAIYWSRIDGICRTKTDGTGTQRLVTTNGQSYGIAIDATGGKMYWTDRDGGKILRSNLNGSEVEDVLTGLAAPTDITLDHSSGKMFWAGFDTGIINSANLDGTNPQTLYTNSSGSFIGIALDITSEKIYWSDHSKILRSNYDGTHVENIISNIDAPFALDIASDKIYWTDATNGALVSANLDGSDLRYLWEQNCFTLGIVVDSDASNVYWAKTTFTPGHPNEPLNAIMRANLDGTNTEAFYPYFTYAMAIGPVPEPATLFILALGGMILRKRKPQITQITQK